ncbi:MAG: helix-turn-helix domain-containing protein [Solirubrobacterales bacterium]|nr:helix-turn-helix domain-containing protein [Solirubrobacterales bacterium]MBV9365060.1 helix-turn-helix domain-containing protein [Solirubrobacterales bacterium]MBV9683145.1 helix-turn-helix domain-containing protein [Solirubrobacterales bacterium]MBV9805705.1 helix-turn-helix domain-containing protein [Solirubrobacterales bacterium]
MAETGTRAVERALTLLTAVAQDGGTLSELARAADLSPSTASRLLATLARQELVRRDEHGHYHAGARLRALAAASLRRDPLHELAGPRLTALASETGETANLAVAADPRRVVYLRQVASPKLVQTAGWVGRTVPCRGTALGAALRGDIGASGFVARTGAVEPDVISIAAPVYGAGGDIVAAISVLAPTYRMTPRRIEACGRAVARHAAALSRSLGYVGAAAA